MGLCAICVTIFLLNRSCIYTSDMQTLTDAVTKSGITTLIIFSSVLNLTEGYVQVLNISKIT